MSFKRGDVVVLKSGGPRMTVDSEQENGELWCVWFDGKNNRSGESFHPDLLMAPPRPAAPQVIHLGRRR